MKDLRFSGRIWALTLLIMANLIYSSSYSYAHGVDPEVAALQAKIMKYQSFNANRQYEGRVRSGIDTLSMVAVLSEEVILHEANKLGLDATDQEATLLLLPFLSQQGLVDPVTENGQQLLESENVRRWLKGQDMEVTDLLKSARLMVLWAKIATHQAPLPSTAEIKGYIEKHPSLRLLPSRIQIEVTTYQEPPMVGTRGLMVHQVLSPNLELGVRGNLAQSEPPPPEDWQALQLYLQLESLDPNLRSVLSGKQAGDVFGRVKLKNGATIGGIVQKFLPEADVSQHEAFWQMASLYLRLEQSSKKEKFEEMVQAYLDESSLAVRGFWKRLFGGFKKGFKYITGGVGGAIGFIVGGPKGALLGARYGYQTGSMIQGYWSSVQRPSYTTPPPIANPPMHFTPQPYPSYSYYAQPASYYRQVRVPSMHPEYARYYERNYYSWRQPPPPPPTWAPPVYLGASVWY